jgi:glucokinase
MTPVEQPSCAIGVDVGGTKCAAGIVALADGRVMARRVQPTEPERGGEAVLATVLELLRSLLDDAKSQALAPESIGIGVAELMDASGKLASHATIDWRGIDVAARVTAATTLPTRIEADVRAAARAEARVGAGRGLRCFLYVTVGTGISSALVIDGCPYSGARGFTGTFASSPSLAPDPTGGLIALQPLESFAAGPALAVRLKMIRPEFQGTAIDVVALGEAGDEPALAIVESAGRAVGSAIAQLVNVLDPAAVVMGGGLGLAGGRYAQALESALRQFIYADGHRTVPLRPASLGIDAGWIGAALASVH